MLYFIDSNPSGIPVVLLHGLGVSSESWQMQIPALLDAGFRPLAPDLPGFGRSAAEMHPWTVADAATSVADLLAHLGASPAHVVGISLGGVVAQQMAFDHPEMVRKLVLVNTFARLRPTPDQGLNYFLRRVWLLLISGREAQAKAVANHLFPAPGQDALRALMIEQIMRADTRTYRSAMLALARFNSLPRLGKLSMPTLVITAAHDGTVAPRLQAQLAQRIPAAQQVVIANAGHAVIVDQPEAFNRALIDFLLQ